MTILKINSNIVDEYLSYNNLYKDKYDKYIVLLMVGSFYEIYSIIPDDTKLKEISNLLNIILTKKNKNIEKISKSNPLLMGFPCSVLDKYIKILINNGYTIPVYTQSDDKKGKKIRLLDKIYSITTYIDENVQLNDYNNITSIYIEKIKNNYLIGLSTIDIITSKNNIYELSVNSINKLIEELNRYLIINNPKEIIYENIDLSDNDNNTIIYFLKNIIELLHIENNYNKEFSKINYQNEFLLKIFKKTNLLSPIEFINMERYQIGLISYIILLNFIYNYDNTSITNISKPIINQDNSLLICHNNAIEQLNIISNNKSNSLFKYINYTSTLIGKRKLKYNLTNPITDIDELNLRYDKIDIMKNKKKNNYYLIYENYLNNIIDIERYHNKLKNNNINPNLYCKLNESYKNIQELITISKKDYKKYINDDLLNKFNEYYSEYLRYFNLTNMNYYINNSFKTSIFNDNIYEDIETILNKINNIKEWMNNLCNELSDIINNKIILEFTDKSGYFLLITKTRCKLLKEKIKDNDKYINLIFDNKSSSTVKITSTEFNKKSYEIMKLYEKFHIVVNEKYKFTCNELYTKYSDCLNYINEFISELDIIKSNTKLSLLYNYTRPHIKNKYEDKSYLICKKLRHPIIERVLDDTNYISNDVEYINNNNKIGILLYGLNGCGKSSYMKSIGVNIILAQSGMFVSSEYFEYYPYKTIFTRINKNDDLFLGKSSFEIEILELKTILDFSDKNSLVLGDEIVNTTEHISATSIISTILNYFLKNNISFIFASHIQHINNYILPELIDKLFIGHLTVEIEDNKLIYSRKLKDNVGIKNYGIIVANYILNNKEFEIDSLKIQNKILDNHNQKDSKNIINTSKSSYNKKLYVDYCYICKDVLNIENKNNLDVHHIKEQYTFEKNESKIKNKKSNLVILCKLHHTNVHKNKIKINKWVKTSSGIELDYVIF